MNQLAKFLFGKMEAPGAEKDEITVGMGPEFHGDLPDVVALEFLESDAGCDGIGDEVERRREPRAEVAGKLASSWTRTGKHVIEDARMGQRVVHVTVHHVQQPGFKRATVQGLPEEPRKLLEFGIDDLVEEGLPVGEMMVDSHGSDADLGGDAPHADVAGTFGFEDTQCGCVDLAGSGILVVHVYSVYDQIYAV